MKLKLPNSVSSQQDVTGLLMDLRTYAQWYQHAAIKQRVGATVTAAQPVLSEAAVFMLNEWAGGQALTPQQLDELIEALEDFKDTAPTLTITLAAPPPKSVKEALVAWCRANIAEDILVSFRFNSTLLGGMVIHHGSRIFDWSFRRKILAKRERIPEVFRRV